jgi:putative peptidoglycan lipid II flippase
VQVLFQHGVFSAADTAATAPALAAYAAGLPAFVAIKVLQPGFFAREDTRTPMRYGVVSMIINVTAALALFYLFGHVGIAAATSIAAWVNTALLYWTLRKRGHLDLDPMLRRRLALLMLASVIMGAGLLAAAMWLAPWLGDRDIVVEGLALAVLVGIGLALFAVSCQVTGAFDFRRIGGLLRRRRKA